VARRFNVETQALTTEELTAAKPPLAIDSRWPELLRILRRFDAERFRNVVAREPVGLVDSVESDESAAAGTSAAARIRGEIDAVKRFVDDSMPPELRR
jgi:hypothetical protein